MAVELQLLLGARAEQPRHAFSVFVGELVHRDSLTYPNDGLVLHLLEVGEDPIGVDEGGVFVGLAVGGLLSFYLAGRLAGALVWIGFTWMTNCFGGSSRGVAT